MTSTKVIFKSKSSYFFNQLFHYIHVYDFETIYFKTEENTITIHGMKQNTFYTFKIDSSLFEEYTIHHFYISLKTDALRVFLENVCNSEYMYFSLFLDDAYNNSLGISIETQWTQRVFYLKTLYIHENIPSHHTITLREECDLISLFDSMSMI
jgi:hypothetical protein